MAKSRVFSRRFLTTLEGVVFEAMLSNPLRVEFVYTVSGPKVSVLSYR